MKHESIVKMIILLGILLYTNPKRAELDSLLLNTFNHNFVKGVSKYLSVNLREAFRGDTSINCAFFSYLRSGRREFYVGIAGMWIEPHYWSTVSGEFVYLQLTHNLFCLPSTDSLFALYAGKTLICMTQ